MNTDHDPGVLVVVGRKGFLSVAAVLIATLVTAAACGSREGIRTGPSATPAMRTEEARAALEALCRMRNSGIARGEAAAAFGRAHDTLHEIAAAVEPLDRSTAARLLEAKSVVEAALEANETTTGFVRSVRALEERTIDSLTELGIEIIGC